MKGFWFVGLLSVAIGCSQTPQFSSEWKVYYESLGTNSSIQCIDLNKDGTLDIVLGSGRNEFDQCDSAVLAMDGKTGRMLWSVSARDQIVGSPAFLDVTRDGILDVFIGGRSSEFIAIDGSTGKVIWRFVKSDKDPIFTCCLHFNFYAPQIIPDQNGDGFKDLLVSNGGNVNAKPFEEEKRYPGVLAILSSVDGEVIAADTMPDGRETYMSPVIHDFKNGGSPEVIFGTGGETVGGNLYRVSLQKLKERSIADAQLLASEKKHGFIAPPLLADITKDGVLDILVNWHGGKMMAFDGKSNARIWERLVENTETYVSVTPIFFNGDDVPDFFSTYSKGMWPDNVGSVQLVVDGKNGEILFRDSVGCSGFSSTVAHDFNADQFTDVIVSINDYKCDGIYLADGTHRLQVWDLHQHTVLDIIPPIHAKNVSTTPWIGDLDGDGFLDIVYCIQANTTQIIDYFGFQVERLRTKVPVGHGPTWGAYMGNDGTSVFEMEVPDR